MSLEMVVGTGGDKVTLKYFYASSYDPNKPFIHELHFDGGAVLSSTDLAGLIPALISEDNDWINGDDGNNVISALGGNDVIFSRAGDDTLEGGLGNDNLYGDAGNDTYIYNTGDGNDIISDTKGINRLVINGQTISQITPTNAELTSYQDAAGNQYTQYTVNSLGWLIVNVGEGATAGRILIIGWDEASNNFGIAMQAVTNVNDAPLADQGISDVSIAEDQALSLAIPADAFSDLDGDTLTYSATLSDGSVLPSWLSFDGTSFTGTPGINDDGNLIIEVTASDGQASAATLFNLTVTDTNHVPTLSLSLVDQSSVENEVFSFTLPADSFTDIDAGDSLSYNATLSEGSPLPTWLSFDANTLTFSGTPGVGDDGNLSIQVTATDLAGASIGDIFELVIAPASGPDISSTPVNFIGTSADEVIYGSHFNDSMDGKFGNDTLYGFDGDDDLKGYAGNDLIIGGRGNDTMDGSLGSDTYRFNLGDGQDTISEYRSASDVNVIEFGPGIAPDDIHFQKSSNGMSLEMVVGTGGDKITLKYFYASSYDPEKSFIDELHFDGGAVLSSTDLAGLIPALISEDNDWLNGDDGNNVISALGGNDVIFSRAGDDTLEGGLGNDSLYGEEGNDTYIYNTGDGNDIISDTKGINRLVINSQTISQITPTNAELTSYQDAAGNQYTVNSLGWLIVNVGAGATAGRISIIGWDEASNNFGIAMQALSNQSPEAVDDAGSTNESKALVFTLAELLSNDSDPEGDALSITSVSNVLNGTAILDNAAGTVTFTPDSGYIGTASFDYTLSDGELTDTGSVNITVSASENETNDLNANVSLGPVNFVGTNADEVVYGSHSADTIDGKFGNDSLFGFDGDDNLKGYIGNDLIVGGKGNDTLNGSLGSDTYRFNLGDGQDTISEYRSASDVNVIEFGTGIEPDDLSFQKSSNGLSLEIVVGSGGDKITLQYFYGSSYDPEKPFIDEMHFENGIVYTSSNLDALIPGLTSEGKDFIIGNADDNTFDALGGNDTVMAGAGNDSLSGGTGDDWLYGQAGDDTYHFQAGDGFDTIHAQSGSSETDFETLVFDDQFDVNNLWFTQNSNNLEIHLLGTNDKVRVYNWFESEQYELDQIQSGSSSIDNSGIEQLISSMAAFGAPSGGEISLSSEERGQVDSAIAAAWQS
jgi:Ca2+-binding RTX toxin-like protein